jgi:hypothetical protein
MTAQRLGIGGIEVTHRADDEVLLDGGEHRLEHGLLDQAGGLPVGDHGLTEPNGVRTWLLMAMMTMSRRLVL